MNSYCVFNVGNRRIGLPMTSVREIIEREIVSTTPVPLTPGFVRGLFNLRGQVLPYFDLSSFVGADGPSAADGDRTRTVIVERGAFRFATLGDSIDTVDADPEKFLPIDNTALFPALDVEAQTERGNFQVIHLDRLEACLGQALKFTEIPDASRSQQQNTGSQAATA